MIEVNNMIPKDCVYKETEDTVYINTHTHVVIKNTPEALAIIDMCQKVEAPKHAVEMMCSMLSKQYRLSDKWRESRKDFVEPDDNIWYPGGIEPCGPNHGIGKCDCPQ